MVRQVSLVTFHMMIAASSLSSCSPQLRGESDGGASYSPDININKEFIDDDAAGLPRHHSYDDRWFISLWLLS